MNETFLLANGKWATVRWVNGPPYLSVSIKPCGNYCDVMIDYLKKLPESDRRRIALAITPEENDAKG